MDKRERAAFMSALKDTSNAEELAEKVIDRFCRSLDLPCYDHERYINQMEVEEAKAEILDVVREAS
jgi:glycerol dehydrogenase-like iron-containing ADH family enzyme